MYGLYSNVMAVNGFCDRRAKIVWSWMTNNRRQWFSRRCSIRTAPRAACTARGDGHDAPSWARQNVPSV